MNRKIEHGFIRMHIREEDIDKFEHMLGKRKDSLESLKTSMISHLAALNDGVIAIFITVMMLEIPYPHLREEFYGFMWSIAVFLVSFFIIAEFWYDNKRIFESITSADHMVVVTNFLFLASLALIPATTKWVMNQTNRYSEITFGIVYFITLIFEQILYYSSIRNRFIHHRFLLLTILITRIGYLLLVNLILMIIAWFFPRAAVILYLTLPILSFFRSEE